MRKFAVLVFFLAMSIAAAPKKSPAPIAPNAIPHPIALFLGTLSKEGARQVTFKASAVGMYFFFEEPTGVTVYRFDKGQYLKAEFLRTTTLAKAMKKYEKK
jgi:hypothetical protein